MTPKTDDVTIDRVVKRVAELVIAANKDKSRQRPASSILRRAGVLVAPGDNRVRELVGCMVRIIGAPGAGSLETTTETLKYHFDICQKRHLVAVMVPE